jgi:hypothetical protein
MELAGIVIAIANSENPVYAITIPATVAGTPATRANPPNHFGYVESTGSATPYTVTVRPNKRLSVLANPISTWRTANAV